MPDGEQMAQGRGYLYPIPKSVSIRADDDDDDKILIEIMLECMLYDIDKNKYSL